MASVLRFLFGDIGIKLTALFVAVFLWVFAVLDRSYVTSFMVPVAVDKIETKKVVTEFQPRRSEVRIEGRGRDLVFFRLRQPRFLLTIPEGLPGVKQLRINPADLDIPANLAISAIIPEIVEYRLSEAGTRRVAVEVPTRGKPGRGLTISRVEPLERVNLLGPEDEVRLYATVFTDSLDLGRVRRSDTVRLRVRPPDEDGFRVDPETVAVAIEVEKEETRIFLAIPVGIEAPEGMRVTVRPSEAQIAVTGPSGRFEEFKPTDIRARVRISGLKPGEHRLAAEINLPSGLQLAKCEPALFDITIADGSEE